MAVENMHAPFHKPNDGDMVVSVQVQESIAHGDVRVPSKTAKNRMSSLLSRASNAAAHTAQLAAQTAHQVAANSIIIPKQSNPLASSPAKRDQVSTPSPCALLLVSF